MSELKLVRIGDGVGVALPLEMLEGLGVGEGDTLAAVFTPGGIQLSAGEAVLEGQMAVARRLMRERQGILRRLADS